MLHLFLILFVISDWQDHQDQVGRKIKRESSAADAADGRTTMMARRSCSMPAAGAGPGSAAAAVNTITPCAACKLLRRRCAQECPFSPYFSPLEPHKFASVHKVFGASNVSKMLLVSSDRAGLSLIKHMHPSMVT